VEKRWVKRSQDRTVLQVKKARKIQVEKSLIHAMK